MKTKEGLHTDDENSVNRRYYIKTSSLMHEEERKGNNFYRITGLIKRNKRHIFDTKSIDYGTFVTKIGQIQQRGTDKHGSDKYEIEYRIL